MFQVLNKLLNPVTNHPRRPTILTPVEEQMLVKRVKQAAERGFAIDELHIRKYMAEIANDGRKTFKRVLPSGDALRSSHARSRTITYRRAEDHSHKYFAGENLDHVNTLVEHLKKIKSDHPDIFADPNRVWNLDETAVNAEYGKRIRVFTSADSNLGGRRHNVKDNGAHLTAVVIESASGFVAPPFFVAAGKKVMPSWMKPIVQTNAHKLPNDLK